MDNKPKQGALKHNKASRAIGADLQGPPTHTATFNKQAIGTEIRHYIVSTNGRSILVHSAICVKSIFLHLHKKKTWMETSLLISATVALRMYWHLLPWFNTLVWRKGQTRVQHKHWSKSIRSKEQLFSVHTDSFKGSWQANWQEFSSDSQTTITVMTRAIYCRYGLTLVKICTYWVWLLAGC